VVEGTPVVMNEYTISVRQASDRRLEFTWTPNPFPSAPNMFWVEYPFDITQIHRLDVFYPALPLFLALGFADSRFHLTSPLLSRADTQDDGSTFEQVLRAWMDIVAREATENFGTTIVAEVDVEGKPVERSVAKPTNAPTPYPGVGLFLGGGAESLLTLAELLESGAKPQLISCVGPGWIGSDPAKNDTKVSHDLRVAQELGLELHHIRTSLYGLFVQMQNDVVKRMVVDAFFVNRAPFTPALVALCAPMTSVYRLGAVYHGHERIRDEDVTFHCFRKSFTDQLALCFAPVFAYRRVLGDVQKVDVFERLCSQHGEFLTYQYSCAHNDHERWCLACEKCFRYYILYKLYDVPFPLVGFDAAQMLKNFDRFHDAIVTDVWSDIYSRSTYSEILAKARARGNKEVEKLITSVIRDGMRLQATRKAKSIVRPFLPASVRHLLKTTLLSASRRNLSTGE
jgi:hypothetical protein